MIVWSSSIDIRRPPEAVFEFLANIQDVAQSDDSPVLALDLITEGPPRLGERKIGTDAKARSQPQQTTQSAPASPVSAADWTPRPIPAHERVSARGENPAEG